MPSKSKIITQNSCIRWCLVILFNTFFLFSLTSACNVCSQFKGKITQYPDKPKRNNKIRTIVIDAGHGGHDPGTNNGKYKEKDITLAIALKTGEFISNHFKDVKVIYTRETDEFIDLKKRAQIANQAKADLFISIHCNAIETNPENFYGTETYVQDPKVEGYNLAIAKRENSAILLEDDYKKNYEGYDPNAPETHILLSMFQNAYLGQSISLAQAFEMESAGFANRKSRGVRQAGFLVLKATTMPSVLIETGFLSNSNEKKFLASKEGQLTIAATICRAFQRYKNSIENEQPIDADIAFKLNDKNISINKTETNKQVGVSLGKANPALENANISDNAGQITFRLQLLATQNEVDTSESVWKNVVGIEMIKDGKYFKYYSKAFLSPDELSKEKKNLKNLGFKDVFTVAFEDGNKINLDEAQRKYRTSLK